MAKTTWPQQVCSTEQSRGVLQGLFRWLDWIVATNGHALIAIPDDGREEVADGGPNLERVWEVGFEEQRDEPVTVSLLELQAWCGRVERRVACIECGGSPRRQPCPHCGKHHGCCVTCGGSGSMDALGLRDRLGVAGGAEQIFSRRLLGLMLDGAPGPPDQVVVITPATEPGRALAVEAPEARGGAWKGLLMPIMPTESEARREFLERAEPLEELGQAYERDRAGQ